MTSDSRARMVRSAASLIRTRGVTGTSFSDVLADSGAPRGSIYHHFPEGKEQLAADAIKWTSERVLAHQRDCPASTPEGVLDRSEEHTSELQSLRHLVCRLLLEKKKN